MTECLERWTPEDLAVAGSERLSREWVVWHLVEHDLHHGGEISNILGSNGLAAPNL